MLVMLKCLPLLLLPICELRYPKKMSWSLHIQTKILKARQSFNYHCSVKHSVPFNLKFIFFKACVLSVLLFESPTWFPEASELRRLEQLNIHGLSWCFGCNDCSSLLKLSNHLPVCFEHTGHDIDFFAVILNNENCLHFDGFFKLDSKVFNL